MKKDSRTKENLKKVEVSEKKTDSLKNKTEKTFKEKEVKGNDSLFDKKTKKPSYISFKDRIIVYSLLILLCFIAAIFFLTKSLSINNAHQIQYNERSNVDYKVHLKKNDFYEKEYLDENMVYVASLINKIDIAFNYVFNIEEKSNMDVDYDIIGKLVISDYDGKNTFFEKEYVLLKNTKESITSKTQYPISKGVSINYQHYNNLANKFRADYGIDTNSNLIVMLRVHEKNNSQSNFNLNNNSSVSVTIPLSEKAINIKIDDKEINNDGQILANSTDVVISNFLYGIISLVFIALIVIISIPMIKLLLNATSKKTKYEKYINKILKEYDRLIVETTTSPSKEKANVITIESFDELLDVRDNLNLPIKYYVIAKNQKCNFYINHEDELYLLTIKSVDMENK